jgi:hypothetical protein
MEYISFPPLFLLPVSIILIDVVLVIGLALAQLYVALRNDLAWHEGGEIC